MTSVAVLVKFWTHESFMTFCQTFRNIWPNIALWNLNLLKSSWTFSLCDSHFPFTMGQSGKLLVPLVRKEKRDRGAITEMRWRCDYNWLIICNPVKNKYLIIDEVFVFWSWRDLWRGGLMWAKSERDQREWYNVKGRLIRESEEHRLAGVRLEIDGNEH